MLGLGFRINKKRKKKGFPPLKSLLTIFYKDRVGKDIINKIKSEENNDE